MDVFQTCLLGLKVRPTDHASQPSVFSGPVFIFYQKRDKFLVAQLPVITVCKSLLKHCSHDGKSHAAKLCKRLFHVHNNVLLLLFMFIDCNSAYPECCYAKGAGVVIFLSKVFCQAPLQECFSCCEQKDFQSAKLGQQLFQFCLRDRVF